MTKNIKPGNLQALSTPQTRTAAATKEHIEQNAERLLAAFLQKHDDVKTVIRNILAENPQLIEPYVSPDRRVQEFERRGLEFLEKIQDHVGNEFNSFEERVAGAFNEMSEAQSREIATTLKKIEAAHYRKIEIRLGKRPPITATNTHKLMPELLRHLGLRHDVALIGPSGSGKTYSARQTSDLLGLPFYFIACSDMDTPTKWFGYMNANGGYVSTAVRQWYENGGVLLIDEYDNMRANIGVNLNAMLDNGLGDFPDGMVTRHPDALCVAAGNTVGRGATRLYRGRQGIDESTLERFDFIHWDYDEELEMKLGAWPSWTMYVQAARRAMRKHKMDYIISPRASMRGGELLLSGLPPVEVSKRVLYKGWPEDDYMRISTETEVQYAFQGIEAVPAPEDDEFPLDESTTN